MGIECAELGLGIVQRRLAGGVLLHQPAQAAHLQLLRPDQRLQPLDIRLGRLLLEQEIGPVEPEQGLVPLHPVAHVGMDDDDAPTHLGRHRRRGSRLQLANRGLPHLQVPQLGAGGRHHRDAGTGRLFFRGGHGHQGQPQADQHQGARKAHHGVSPSPVTSSRAGSARAPVSSSRNSSRTNWSGSRAKPASVRWGITERVWK